MDYQITGYAITEILSVVGSMVHHHLGDKTLSISTGEDDLCEP